MNGEPLLSLPADSVAVRAVDELLTRYLAP